MIMGPNARRPKLDRAPSPSRTHEEVDKIIAAEHSTEQWVIGTQFDSGDTAYWGKKRDGGDGLTPYRSNAKRYVSENAALHMAYSYKESGLIGPFVVEQLPPSPAPGRGAGTGGRA
jgi:hypothetical protein